MAAASLMRALETSTTKIKPALLYIVYLFLSTAYTCPCESGKRCNIKLRLTFGILDEGEGQRDPSSGDILGMTMDGAAEDVLGGYHAPLLLLIAASMKTAAADTTGAHVGLRCLD